MNLLNLLRKKPNPLYGLDHAILNIQLPPPTMWMNMGYWEKESNLPEASRALLDQVLISAGFLDSCDKNASDHVPDGSEHGMNTLNTGSINLIDIGFGCGDQTLYLAEHFPDLLSSYIGITMLATHTELAATRLAQSNTIPSALKERINLFTADASNPQSWAREIHHSIASTTTTTTTTTANKQPNPPETPQTWILALDSLYHFHPSRLPFLAYTTSALKASLMGFDLVLSPSASFWDKFLLRIMCWGSGIPFGNFLTPDEYVALFVRAGYQRDRVEVRDVSEHVFDGLVGFISKRDRELSAFGLPPVRRLRVVKWVFGWWARSGVVRGVVVTARK